MSAYYCRIKGFISSGRGGMAVKDARRLQKYDHEKGNSMMNEAASAVQRKQKEDRKLAKEISKWVGHAVHSSKMEDGDDDIAVPRDDDVEEERQGGEREERENIQDKDCNLM